MGKALYYAARAAGRTAVRTRNQQIRSREAAIRRQEKEEYVNSKCEEAETLNDNIKQLFEKYRQISDYICFPDIKIDFESKKKQFTNNKFEYKDKPKYIDNASKIIVPKESKLEKIFKSKKDKRVNSELLKENQIKKDKECFEKNLLNYEKEKESAYSNFLLNEEKRKQEIVNDNLKVDELKEKYFNHDKEAFQTIIVDITKEMCDLCSAFHLQRYNLEYDSSTGKLFVQVFLPVYTELFEYSKVRYIKSTDEMEYKLLSESEAYKELKYILPRLAYGFASMYYGTDEGNYFNKVIIDIMYCSNTSISLCVTKDEHDTKSVEEILSNNARIFNSLNDSKISYNDSTT